MTTDIHALQAQLAEAEAAEAIRTKQAQADVLTRERAYRNEWLGNYDRGQLQRNVSEAQRRVYDAFASTPAFAALAELQVAHHVARRSAEIAHNHRAWLATDRGEEPPADAGTPAAPELVADELVTWISRLVIDRLQDWQEGEDARWAAAVYGADLTHEQILEQEALLEQARRAEAAQVTAKGSLDVTGMTDEEREQHGLQPGHSRTTDQRRGY